MRQVFKHEVKNQNAKVQLKLAVRLLDVTSMGGNVLKTKFQSQAVTRQKSLDGLLTNIISFFNPPVS